MKLLRLRLEIPAGDWGTFLTYIPVYICEKILYPIPSLLLRQLPAPTHKLLPPNYIVGIRKREQYVGSSEGIVFLFVFRKKIKFQPKLTQRQLFCGRQQNLLYSATVFLFFSSAKLTSTTVFCRKFLLHIQPLYFMSDHCNLLGFFFPNG